MRSALTVAIAVLLVSSLLPVAILASATSPTGAVSGAGTTDPKAGDPLAKPYPAAQVDSDDTTTRLGLDGPSTSAYTEPTPDLGTTLATTDDELRQEWSIHELESQWSELSNAERREQIEAYEDRINDRLSELDEREQAITSAMVAGDVPAARVLRTLVRNDHEATVLAENLNRLSALADEIPNYTLPTRSTLTSIETHEGPVRDRALKTMSASTPTGTSSVVLIEAADSGVVVSAITGGTYFREATRYDHRDPTRSIVLEDLSDGNDRLDEIYPWANGNRFEEGKSLGQFPSSQQFHFESRHAQGVLRAYLDSGTTEVFRENQELWLETLPLASSETWTGERMAVSVNATVRAGPMQVTVTDRETGDPLNATILVDGQPAVETGAEGTAWIVRPMADAEFVVQTNDESITVDPDR